MQGRRLAPPGAHRLCPRAQIRARHRARVGHAGAGRPRGVRAGSEELAAATGLDPEVAADVHPLVAAKLAMQPVEDLRIDFEDGYVARDDDTEDAHARAAARALATVLRPTRAAFSGCGARAWSRHQAPGHEDAAVFLETLLDYDRRCRRASDHAAEGHSAAQVSAMAVVCERLERAWGIGPVALAFEIQVETPQAILGAGRHATVAACVHAG